MCYTIHSHYNTIIQLKKDLKVYKLIRQRMMRESTQRLRLEGPYYSAFEFKEGETYHEQDFGRYAPSGSRKNRKGKYIEWEVDEGFHSFSNFISALAHKARYFDEEKYARISGRIVVYEATVPAGSNIRYNPNTSIVLSDCLRLDRITNVKRTTAMLEWTRDLVNNLVRPKDPMFI